MQILISLFLTKIYNNFQSEYSDRYEKLKHTSTFEISKNIHYWLQRSILSAHRSPSGSALYLTKRSYVHFVPETGMYVMYGEVDTRRRNRHNREKERHIIWKAATKHRRRPEHNTTQHNNRKRKWKWKTKEENTGGGGKEGPQHTYHPSRLTTQQE